MYACVLTNWLHIHVRFTKIIACWSYNTGHVWKQKYFLNNRFDPCPYTVTRMKHWLVSAFREYEPVEQIHRWLKLDSNPQPPGASPTSVARTWIISHTLVPLTLTAELSKQPKKIVILLTFTFCDISDRKYYTTISSLQIHKVSLHVQQFYDGCLMYAKICLRSEVSVQKVCAHTSNSTAHDALSVSPRSHLQ